MYFVLKIFFDLGKQFYSYGVSFEYFIFSVVYFMMEKIWLEVRSLQLEIFLSNNLDFIILLDDVLYDLFVCDFLLR